MASCRERGTDAACDGCAHGVGEEHPGVRTAPGLGDLQRGWYRAGAGGLAVGERIEHRGGSIEVRDQEVAGVAGPQRIKPDEHVADQMGRDYLRGEWQVGDAPAIHSFAPSAGDRRHPSTRIGASILPADRVHVRACLEQIGIQGQLVRGPRAHRDRARRGDGSRELLRRRGCVLAPQFEQARQPGILGAESLQLPTEPSNAVVRQQVRGSHGPVEAMTRRRLDWRESWQLGGRRRGDGRAR